MNPAPTQRLKASRLQSVSPISQFTAKTLLGWWMFPHFKKIQVGDTEYSLTYESPLVGEEKAMRALFMAYRK